MTKCISIFVFSETAVTYLKQPHSAWQLMKVRGDDVYTHHHEANSLPELLNNITAHLNSETALKDIQVTLVYEKSVAKLLTNCIAVLHEKQCDTWQILSWQDVYTNTCALLGIEKDHFNSTDIDHDWMMTSVLPLIGQTAFEVQKKELLHLSQEKQNLEKHIAEMNENEQQAWQQQLNKLEQEKQQLHAQITQADAKLQRLQQPNIEYLVTFLPVMFRDFWNNVRPYDLALIAGNLNVPEIASPYLEPSSHTVLQKKKQFLALDTANQQQVLLFCQELKNSHQQLKVHPEFKAIMQDIH